MSSSLSALSDSYRLVVQRVSERLRSIGFKGRGGVFRLLQDGNCALIEFQRSTKNSDEQLVFTVNVGVIYGALLDPERLNIESGTAMHAHLRQRLGMLLPLPKSNKWWVIDGGTDAGSLGSEIQDLIEKFAVPYLRQYVKTEAIRLLWESGRSPGITEGERARLLARLVALGA